MGTWSVDWSLAAWLDGWLVGCSLRMAGESSFG